MKSPNSRIRALSATFLLVALAACGGGGGDSAPSPAPTPTQPPAPVPPPPPAPAPSTAVQTTVPTSTYAANSAEGDAYAVINGERLRCGAGLQAQSTTLDVAAAGHANYLKLRWEEGVNAGHLQTTGLTGFTAVTGSQRAAAAGYTGISSGEQLSYAYDNGLTPIGDQLARRLMATVYHLAGLFGPERDVGVGVSYAKMSNGFTLATLAYQPGLPTGTAGQRPTDVITYPCDGSTGVKGYFEGESPDPFAGVNMGAYTTLGTPIYVKGLPDSTVVVQSAEIAADSGAAVPVFIYTAAVDPQKVLSTNAAFVIPLERLAVSTRYTVQIRGTTNGTAFAKAFQFTTGKF